MKHVFCKIPFCPEKDILLKNNRREYFFKKDEPIWFFNRRMFTKPLNCLNKIVLKRDNYACQNCNLTKDAGIILNVHHIKPVNEFPNLILDIDNCITLCKNCHKKIHEKKEEVKKEGEVNGVSVKSGDSV